MPGLAGIHLALIIIAGLMIFVAENQVARNQGKRKVQKIVIAFEPRLKSQIYRAVIDVHRDLNSVHMAIVRATLANEIVRSSEDHLGSTFDAPAIYQTDINVLVLQEFTT